MTDMVRLNARVSPTVYEWLDEYSKRTGMPKSTIIFLAIEQYKRDYEAIQGMKNIVDIAQELSELRSEIKKLSNAKE